MRHSSICKTYFSTLFLSLFLTLTAVGQTKNTDDLRLYDRLDSISDENIFRTEGYYNWGGSVIKDSKGIYHLFYSRWSKDKSFTGWLTHSEIAHATSKTPTGPWTFQKTVLKGRKGENWDAVNAHNPKIKYFEGKYYLYYISTNAGKRQLSESQLTDIATTGYRHVLWKTLRENMRTGVAISNSIEGPWKRMDSPLIEPSGPISTLTVNPAIAQGRDNKYYLIVKGDKPNEKKFIRNQAIAISKSPDGPFKMQEKPVIDYMDTEDMSLWYDHIRQRFYGVYHAGNYIGLVTSTDGISWNPSDETVITPKRYILKSGEIIKPERFERPFIYIEDNEPLMLSIAIKEKNDSYIIFHPIKPEPEHPRPNHRQLAWQEAEFGAVIHYDLHVFDGKQYSQVENRLTPVQNYQIFYPKNLDTDQWIKAVKEAGMTFAILTATHETGFALFQSDFNPYSMKALKFQEGKGDIVRDFVNSCHKYGIKPGVYIGLRWNSHMGVHNFQVDGTGKMKENRQDYYNHMIEGMVKELCTNYGEWFEIWFDGGADHPRNGAPNVLPIVRAYQPNALFYHNLQLAEARWGGSESGKIAYPSWSTFTYKHTGAGEDGHPEILKNNFELLKTGDPNGKYWMPAMSDAPLRGYGAHEWFWEPDTEKNIFPLENLIDIYYHSVGRNSTLIMGLTPDPNGLIPKADALRLKEWGTEIAKIYSNEIASTSGSGKVFRLKWKVAKEIKNIVLREDLQHGERVRKFKIEAQINKKWKIIYEGSNIGNKHLIKVENVKTNTIRLTVLEATEPPLITSFSAYN